MVLILNPDFSALWESHNRQSSILPSSPLCPPPVSHIINLSLSPRKARKKKKKHGLNLQQNTYLLPLSVQYSTCRKRSHTHTHIYNMAHSKNNLPVYRTQGLPGPHQFSRWSLSTHSFLLLLCYKMFQAIWSKERRGWCCAERASR